MVSTISDNPFSLEAMYQPSLGATLTRLEGQEIFHNLANRFESPDLEIPVETPEYDQLIGGLRALEALPVTVTNAWQQRRRRALLCAGEPDNPPRRTPILKALSSPR